MGKTHNDQGWLHVCRFALVSPSPQTRQRKKSTYPASMLTSKKQVDYIQKTSARFWGHFWLRVEIGLKSGRLHQSFKNMRANKNRSLRVKIGLVFDFALSLALASWAFDEIDTFGRQSFE